MVARLYMIVPSGYFDLMIQSGADGNLSSFNRSSESRSSVSSHGRPLGIPIQHLRPPSTQRDLCRNSVGARLPVPGSSKNDSPTMEMPKARWRNGE